MVSLQDLAGIGPKTLAKLARLQIFTPTDLLYHFPRRYLDFSHLLPIYQTQINQEVTVKGVLTNFQNIFTKTGKNLQIATIADSTGSLVLAWFNQPYISKNFVEGQTYAFAGKISFWNRKKTIFSPEYGDYHTGKIISLYPETSGLSSKWFRKIINQNLSRLLPLISDPLPDFIKQQFHLSDLLSALTNIHLPPNEDKLATARFRLGLDEIISLQAQSYLNRQHWLSLTPKFTLTTSPQIEKKITQFIKKLPFKLTKSQVQAWAEIKADILSSSSPTNRLLVGDVGSGKTIVATLACLQAHFSGVTSLLIAPTAILAHQHYQNFQKMLPHLTVHLLTSQKKLIHHPQPGEIIIATHAAIYQSTKFIDSIGLLIIDEQHKFGVNQRLFLNHSLNPPHTLTLTATPIPRSISLTYLGHLDLSLMTTLPNNRQTIKTHLVPQHKKDDCYHWISHQIQQFHHQVFWVCPFIEESETATTVKSAQKEFAHLQKLFPDLHIELIHSKIKTDRREKILTDFYQGKVDILVTTPIIEVGIDVPNAAIIVIESAERFGLASLHQLRGRVGRGDTQSFCFLFTDSEDESTHTRLRYLENHHLGFEIAKFDLANRGPGEIFSTLQHGFPSLKLADLNNLQLIDTANQIVSKLATQANFNLQTLIKNQPSNPANAIGN